MRTSNPLDRNTYHKKVIAGAVVMLEPSMKFVAPATMHPTTSPTMMLAFFKKGEPKSSVMTMVENDKKPSPMNSGEPQLQIRSAAIHLMRTRGSQEGTRSEYSWA